MTKSIGSIKLSKSEKALIIFVENRRAMVSVKSIQKLLNKEKPYVKVWEMNEAKETHKPNEGTTENSEA